MNFKRLKSTVIVVLSVLLLGLLFVVWVPTMRRQNQASDDPAKVIEESKRSIEQVKAELERIEKVTPGMPPVPAENEQEI